jgi:hypothetical protein
MENEEFKNLPVNLRLEYAKILMDNFSDSVRRRMEILPSASALAAMLLIVATFGGQIIQINNTIKFLLSLLLIIIPAALFFYNCDLKGAQKKNLKYMDKLMGLNLEKELEDMPANNKFISIFPDVIIYLLAFVVVIIICFIWIPKNTPNNLSDTERQNYFHQTAPREFNSRFFNR